MTTSAISENKPNPLRVIAAWGVHLFTATGAIWGFLAMLAIFEHDWRAMIIYMIVAMLVDGFDGMLARWADVKKYANGVDGALLDNILDYLNYVVVPALFSWKRVYCLTACRWSARFPFSSLRPINSPKPMPRPTTIISRVFHPIGMSWRFTCY